MKKAFVLLLGTGLLGTPLIASAHAALKQSTPANGSTVAAAPDHFSLTFSESAHLTALSIQKEGDAVAQKITPLPSEAGKTFSVAAPKLAAGSYTLSYRNVAADDNHVASGTIKFTIAP